MSGSLAGSMWRRISCHSLPWNTADELLYALDDPGTAMFEALTAVGILAAQEGAAHAARDHVIPRGVGERDEGGAGAGHGVRLVHANDDVKQSGGPLILASVLTWLNRRLCSRVMSTAIRAGLNSLDIRFAYPFLSFRAISARGS